MQLFVLMLGFAFKDAQVGDTGAVEMQDSVIYPKQYYQLEEFLQKYDSIASHGGWIDLPDDMDSIGIGSKGRLVLLLRSRLEAERYISKDIVSDRDSFDLRLQNALNAFQINNGLIVKNYLDRETISTLNIPVSKRLAQIKVNMERWKTLPASMGAHYLFVNIADFKLDVWRNDTPVVSMNVVVGKIYRKTPVFQAKLSHIIFNPTWNIPATILKEDILPLVLKDTSYLRKRHIRLYHTEKGGRRHEFPSDSVDWNNMLVEHFPYELIQDAGGDNALGAVKFMFPNSYNVYLHDTPSKELFKKSERVFSSGCIRVSDAVTLASHLLGISKKKVRSYIQGGETTTVYLHEPINVFIEYFTAWVDVRGVLQFRKDVYDRDSVAQEQDAFLEGE